MEDNTKKVPEIRFPGFTDAWEQRKFGELYEKNNEKNVDLIGYDRTISIATMTFKDDGNGASDESLASYKVLREGDLAFEGHTNKEFRYGRFVLNDIGTGIMSPRFSTLRPLEEMPISFWKYYIHYEPVMRKILVNSTKAGTMMNELVIPEFMEQDILVPSKEEQNAIGNYISTIDSLITLHQRECDTLKRLKSGMLQKMFPKDGESVPEIRFPGFTDAWEQRKLGEIAGNVYGGGTPKTSVKKYWDGEIPWIQSSNVQEDVLFDIDIPKAITEEGLNKSAAKLVPANSIAVVTHVGVGKLVYMPFSYATSQDFTSLSDLKTDAIFTCYSIYNRLQKDLHIVQGSAIKGITKDDLLTKEIWVPNITEQKMIGAYFRSLDQLITLHQRECETLKKLKAAMLQKMFVS